MVTVRANAAAPAGFMAGAVLESHAAGVTFEVTRRDEAPPGAAVAATPPGAARAKAERFVCKRLSSRTRGEEAPAGALVNEGRLLEALGGRGAPRVVAQGADDAGPFLVLEWIAMRALGASPRAPDRLGRAARAALRRLGEVHSAADARGPLEVVHADLNPANVLVAADDGDACLVDFGLARWRDGPPAAPGDAFRGTLLYAAPELARGEAIDARADLFALAATILHVASGVAPRAGPPAAVLALAGEATLEAWARRAASALEPALGAALVACCAFDPSLRPPSAASVLASC